MWVNTYYTPPNDCELVNLDQAQHVYLANDDGAFHVAAEMVSGERINLTEAITEETARTLFADICDGLRTGKSYLDLYALINE